MATKEQCVKIIECISPTSVQKSMGKEIIKSLAQDDLWQVPYSGLVFRKVGNGLVWVHVVPIRRLPTAPEHVAACQEWHYQRLKRIFKAANVSTRKELKSDDCDSKGCRL